MLKLNLANPRIKTRQSSPLKALVTGALLAITLAGSTFLKLSNAEDTAPAPDVVAVDGLSLNGLRRVALTAEGELKILANDPNYYDSKIEEITRKVAYKNAQTLILLVAQLAQAEIHFTKKDAVCKMVSFPETVHVAKFVHGWGTPILAPLPGHFQIPRDSNESLRVYNVGKLKSVSKLVSCAHDDLYPTKEEDREAASNVRQLLIALAEEAIESYFSVPPL